MGELPHDERSVPSRSSSLPTTPRSTTKTTHQPRGGSRDGDQSQGVVEHLQGHLSMSLICMLFLMKCKMCFC